MSKPLQQRLARNLRGIDLWSHLRTGLLILGGLLVANVLFYLFLTRPRLELAAGSRADLRSAEQELRSVRADLREVRDRLSKIHCVAEDLSRFREEVLSEKIERMTRVQKALRELAQTFRMDPSSIDYEISEQEETSLLSFAITFPLEGSYEDLRQFLRHIESSEHFLLIERISLSGSLAGGASLNLSIKLRTFFATEDTEREPSPGAATARRAELRREKRG